VDVVSLPALAAAGVLPTGLGAADEVAVLVVPVLGVLVVPVVPVPAVPALLTVVGVFEGAVVAVVLPLAQPYPARATATKRMSQGRAVFIDSSLGIGLLPESRTSQPV
jgi:hypothetical protein